MKQSFRAGIVHFVFMALVALILCLVDYRLCVFPLVYAVGALVGVTEILMRFRDEPLWAVNSGPGTVYAVLNGLGSVLAFCLIRYLDIWFGATPDSAIGNVLQVLTAGVGAMSFLRSGIFISKASAGDADIALGPAVVLQRILDVLSNQVDRQRAVERDRFIATVAQRLGSGSELTEFAAYAMALMQTLTKEAENSIGEALREIQAGSWSPLRKNQIAALLLLNCVGEDALRAALERMTTDPAASGNSPR
jgi:hypothetical protein